MLANEEKTSKAASLRYNHSDVFTAKTCTKYGVFNETQSLGSEKVLIRTSLILLCEPSKLNVNVTCTCLPFSPQPRRFR